MEGKEKMIPKFGNSKLTLTVAYSLNMYYLGGSKTSSKKISLQLAQADGGTSDWWQMQILSRKSTQNAGLNFYR